MEKSNKPDQLITGILLAAGSSSRLGSPKQLLIWKNQYLINFVINEILRSKINDLVVVLGENGQKIKNVIKHKVKIIHNGNWIEGKSSSIKAGISLLNNETQGAMFFVVDQPFININLINKLINEFNKTPDHIIVPCNKGRICNPVLFPKKCFSELVLLSGDEGGKQIIKHTKHIKWNNFDDERLFLDIDTKADYEEILSDLSSFKSLNKDTDFL